MSQNQTITINLSDDAEVLARTLWGEARGEGLIGMALVAQVILNRMRRPGWWTRQAGDGVPDDTIAAACLDPWQFSCWNAGDPNRAKLLALTDDDKIFRLARIIAGQAVAGTLGADATAGATHYMTAARRRQGWPKSWGTPKEPCAVVGRHLFYNDID